MNLKSKLVFTGIALFLVPMVLIGATVFYELALVGGISDESSRSYAENELDLIVQGLYSRCETQATLIQETVNSSLNVARRIMHDTGEVSFSTTESVTWNAVNQYTKKAVINELPKMTVGDVWLGNNTDMRVESPIVDEIKNMVGGTCTIFQRMNDAGDMLRVCTNVEKLDGTRAVGTFIPSMNPDGTPNPVVQTVLRGETFKGRAFVVNKWYITAYEPIFNGQSEVVGILYVGVAQESGAGMRDYISNITIAETGYVYVLNSKGEYVISRNGERDGEDLSQSQDADGNYFVQEIIKKAHDSREGETFIMRYPWGNSSGEGSRMKVNHITYFRDWDWIIGAGSYEDEIYATGNRINRIEKSGSMLIIIISLLSLVAVAVTWMFFAGGIVKKISSVANSLQSNSHHLTSISGQVSESSKILADGTSEQASGLEEISASFEEMTAMTRQNADNLKQADDMSKTAMTASAKGKDAMLTMSEAMDKIQTSSNETAKIIKTIDEIAFQTNLLALNAAVEAARAGEAGAGFAVVAEEVRNLAMRSAEAAKNTSSLIEDSQNNAVNGVRVSVDMSEILVEISTCIEKVTGFIDQVTVSSQEQFESISQINSAVTQLDKATQANAAGAEETASSSGEMSHQALELNELVNVLNGIIGESRNNGRIHNIDIPERRNSHQISNQNQRTLHAARLEQPAIDRQNNTFDRNVIPLDEEFKAF